MLVDEVKTARLGALDVRRAVRVQHGDRHGCPERAAYGDDRELTTDGLVEYARVVVGAPVRGPVPQESSTLTMVTDEKDTRSRWQAGGGRRPPA